MKYFFYLSKDKFAIRGTFSALTGGTNDKNSNLLPRRSANDRLYDRFCCRALTRRRALEDIPLSPPPYAARSLLFG